MTELAHLHVTEAYYSLRFNNFREPAYIQIDVHRRTIQAAQSQDIFCSQQITSALCKRKRPMPLASNANMDAMKSDLATDTIGLSANCISHREVGKSHCVCEFFISPIHIKRRRGVCTLSSADPERHASLRCQLGFGLRCE